jgi:hypothetical protein
MNRTFDEAAARARSHLRAAFGEGVEAVRVLLEGGTAGHAALPPDLRRALDRALCQEIERWERRAIDDPEARTVLQAFVALRALLSPTDRPTPAAPSQEPPPRRSAAHRERSARPRVQRFEVER